jgi:8-oxo-dGTP pyrophosphatase MutT (NUDIX family)
MFDSAGAILFSLNENLRRTEYLLLHHTSGHWDFSKGDIESGEDDLNTARREIYEETGISDIEFVKGFVSKIGYYFRGSEKLAHKKVIFYTGRFNRLSSVLYFE